ncbi:hypothetical protein EDEG_01260 [Edhazardia aedis USNM 41457]|uniref:Uncharacterized protein n=1 Tax=Edhazardia aedis (strain USNM 41457) TaxID=1003232 RepID=J9DAI4_EDHAE|nr:hypothetical protein EDEG_01260 [Edhazardia aedis USNM 41457]|eukprot:EJW04519.1 hypothetical protein EDEG_01260 [Edhazardia aedis USNM 41457]
MKTLIQLILFLCIAKAAVETVKTLVTSKSYICANVDMDEYRNCICCIGMAYSIILDTLPHLKILNAAYNSPFPANVIINKENYKKILSYSAEAVYSDISKYSQLEDSSKSGKINRNSFNEKLKKWLSLKSMQNIEFSYNYRLTYDKFIIKYSTEKEIKRSFIRDLTKLLMEYIEKNPQLKPVEAFVIIFKAHMRNKIAIKLIEDVRNNITDVFLGGINLFLNQNDTYDYLSKQKKIHDSKNLMIFIKFSCESFILALIRALHMSQVDLSPFITQSAEKTNKNPLETIIKAYVVDNNTNNSFTIKKKQNFIRPIRSTINLLNYAFAPIYNLFSSENISEKTGSNTSIIYKFEATQEQVSFEKKILSYYLYDKNSIEIENDYSVCFEYFCFIDNYVLQNTYLCVLYNFFNDNYERNLDGIKFPRVDDDITKQFIAIKRAEIIRSLLMLYPNRCVLERYCEHSNSYTYYSIVEKNK